MKRTLILLFSLTLVGCAAKQIDTGMLAAGGTLKVVGNQFVQAEKVYAKNCHPIKPAFKKFCPGMYAFAPKFKKAYNPALDAYEAAVNANDTSKALGAQAAILQLSVELSGVLASIVTEVQ
jgi:hypothetical protein